MIYGFREWFEAIQTTTNWGQDIGTTPERDVLGIPKSVRPGFRKADRTSIVKSQDEVERYLDEATRRLGVHWHIVYYETPENTPITPSQPSHRQTLQAGAPAWRNYSNQAWQYGQQLLQKGFDPNKWPAAQPAVENQDPNTMMPSDPSNTIVYVKGTSRVHGLGTWQQLHNMGHAVWGQAKKNTAKFIKYLRQAIFEMQQQTYDPQGAKPTWSEMVVVLARLMDLKSFSRIFSLDTGGLDTPKVRANTALNSIMEAMFEMVANYLKNKGKINLRPRTATPTTPERTGKMEPSAEVVRKFGVRPWVWEAMQSGEQWAMISEKLTAIVDEAIKDCVWAKVGGPIYSTKGYITMEP